MTIIVYSLMIPNEQKMRFQGITHVLFFVFDSRVFELFNEVLIFFLRCY